MAQQSAMPTAAQLQQLLDGKNNGAFAISPRGQSFESISRPQPADSKIVAFGTGLSGEQCEALLRALLSDVECSVCCYGFKPLEQLSSALVIEGIDYSPELKAKCLHLSEELEVEITAVRYAPKLDEPGVLLMDMDSTAIEIECIDEIAMLAGVGEQVAMVTKRAMQGELDFAQSLHERVAALAGADERILEQVASDMPLMPGLEALVALLKSKGWVVAIASGGFTYFTNNLQKRLGLSATYANVLEVVDGKLTGKVLGDIVDAQIKAQVVTQLAKVYDIDPKQTVAIGDGANDLLMLDKASLGVAFHAKPVVREKAQSAVNQGSLAQLLYLLR